MCCSWNEGPGGGEYHACRSTVQIAPNALDAFFCLPWSPCNSFRCATLVFSNEYDRAVGRSATMGKTVEGEVIFIKHYKCSKDFTLSVCLFPSVSLSVRQSVRISIGSLIRRQSVTQSVCQSVSLSVCQSVSLSVCQSVSLSVCQSVSLSVRLTVCLSVNWFSRLISTDYMCMYNSLHILPLHDRWSESKT